MSHVIIVDQYEDLYFLKVGHDYHVIQHFKEGDIVKSVYSGDRINGCYVSAEGFTADSIRAVTKGRKLSTAKAYFNEMRRRRQRASDSDGSLNGIK